MKFIETELPGAYMIELEPLADSRGEFARTFCRGEFESHGLNGAISQCSLALNRRRGTLRGLHFQRPPHAEVKLVRVIRGAVHDVIVDLREDSPTYMKWLAVQLDATSRRMLYVPQGFAHGYQTLEDDTELFYQMSTPYHPESAAGIRWNDPAFGIEWPIPRPIMSGNDHNWPRVRA